MWSSSDRRARLPRDWGTRVRPRILRRDQYQCQWPVAGGICGAHANQVDHIDPNGGDDDQNLRALCECHHRLKSSSEGGRAVRRGHRRARVRTVRPPETHPGLS